MTFQQRTRQHQQRKSREKSKKKQKEERIYRDEMQTRAGARDTKIERNEFVDEGKCYKRIIDVGGRNK